MISLDANGIIEYWSPSNYELPNHLKFRTKLTTDLYELAKHRVSPLAFTWSQNEDLFAVLGSDSKVRIFEWLTGKIKHSFLIKPAFSESLLEEYHMDKLEFERR